MSEVWKDIVGYEGLYQVSNMGRVKSLREWNGNRHKAQYREREHILNPTDNGNGYLIIGLRNGAKRKNHYIHRLVAAAFIPNPNGLKYVNHLDYDKRNNAVDNLEWCTQRENILYSVEHMRKPHNNKLPSTGERYIREKDGRYELTIKEKYIGRFATLEDAIARRNELLGVMNYEPIYC